MRSRVNIDTFNDAKEIVDIAYGCKHPVYIESSDGCRVNARSLLGVLASVDFNEIWIVSDTDIYNKISKFVV